MLSRVVAVVVPAGWTLTSHGEEDVVGRGPHVLLTENDDDQSVENSRGQKEEGEKEAIDRPGQEQGSLLRKVTIYFDFYCLNP